jgi:hypothetical protein
MPCSTGSALKWLNPHLSQSVLHLSPTALKSPPVLLHRLLLAFLLLPCLLLLLLGWRLQHLHLLHIAAAPALLLHELLLAALLSTLLLLLLFAAWAATGCVLLLRTCWMLLQHKNLTKCC